jgi:hypothetical protein
MRLAPDQSALALELLTVREQAKASTGFDALLYWEARARSMTSALEAALRELAPEGSIAAQVRDGREAGNDRRIRRLGQLASERARVAGSSLAGR